MFKNFEDLWLAVALGDFIAIDEVIGDEDYPDPDDDLPMAA